MTNENISVTEVQNENSVIAERRAKLLKLREHGVAYPNDFVRKDLFGDLNEKYGSKTAEELAALAPKVACAGRVMLKRVMGRLTFATVRDYTGTMQYFVQESTVGEAAYADFKTLDLGDIVACEGTLMRTQAGDLAIKVTSFRLMAKSLRPMPDKHKGLQDQEFCYRRRYVDLMVNAESRERFIKRSKAIASIRNFMLANDFLEVETPMLHPIPGGANARPFITHHNALNTEMYLRIAPELYLKRLVVGGFERVFEINRNFRNEGIDRRHNPEFTMLEAYCACGDFETMANMVEELICHLAEKFCGGLQIDHKDAEGNVLYTIDLSRPWKRADYQDLIRGVAGEDWFDISPEARRIRCEELGVEISPDMKDVDVSQQVYEKLVEEKTMNPCFVTHVAKDLVPLAKLNRENPDVVDVYELVINGQEISPGYSELNDPDVQKERLEHQAAGETQRVDYDFIETLEYGMPSAGGIGIGIDRVVMMLTGASSIRDVLLFPQLKRKDS